MKVRDLVEVSLLYVGIPAVTLYPLGFVGLLIQLWRDNFFPYNDYDTDNDYDTVWSTVTMVPNTVVVGTGVELLYFSVVSTLLGVIVAPLISTLLRKPRRASVELRGRKGWWGLYLLVVLPTTAFLAYHSAYVNDRNDLIFLAGFLMFSAGGGVLIRQVRSRGTISGSFPGLRRLMWRPSWRHCRPPRWISRSYLSLRSIRSRGTKFRIAPSSR